MTKRTEHDHGGHTSTHVGHTNPHVSHNMPETHGSLHGGVDGVTKHTVEGPHHANVHHIPTTVHHYPGHAAEHPGSRETDEGPEV